MIGYLQGTVFHKNDHTIVLLTEGGVGYSLFLPKGSLGVLTVGEAATFWVYTHVREDALVLFGFTSREEMRMFELLISVSGVGPKKAIDILSLVDTPTLQTAIASQDAGILTQVSGIGRKVAEKIVLELQNKVTAVIGMDTKDVRLQQESLEALVALGYSVGESREALKSVPANVSDVGERIKAALRLLGK